MPKSTFIEKLIDHPEVQGSLWLLMTNERFGGITQNDRFVSKNELQEMIEPKYQEIITNVN